MESHSIKQAEHRRIFHVTWDDGCRFTNQESNVEVNPTVSAHSCPHMKHIRSSSSSSNVPVTRATRGAVVAPRSSCWTPAQALQSHSGSMWELRRGEEAYILRLLPPVRTNGMNTGVINCHLMRLSWDWAEKRGWIAVAWRKHTHGHLMWKWWGNHKNQRENKCNIVCVCACALTHTIAHLCMTVYCIYSIQSRRHLYVLWLTPTWCKLTCRGGNLYVIPKL